MSDVAIRETNGRALDIPLSRPAHPVQSSAITTLAEWAAELTAAGTLAQQLCGTPFVPSHFRANPAAAAAAILTGHELGLSPMAALRSIFLISGTPGMYAKTMVAVVQAQGHSVWVEEQSKDKVIVCGRRKDWPAERPDARTIWDLERVKTAELLSNAQYKKNPQQMMTARGQAEICRQVAPDALLGIPYSAEELEDFGPERAREVQQAPVTVDEILGVMPTSQAAIDAPKPVGDQPAEPKPMANAQRNRIIKALADKGVTDPDQILTLLSTALGRDVNATKELTEADGDAIDVAIAKMPNRSTAAKPEPGSAPTFERAAKTVAAFASHGVTRDQMETKVGKPIPDWTDTDIDNLMVSYQDVMAGKPFLPPSEPEQSMQPRQRARMFALFGEVSMTDEDEQRRYMGQVLGREVESRGDLTSVEAAKMIDALVSYKAQNEPPADVTE